MNNNLKFFTSEELHRFWQVVDNDTSRHRVRNMALMHVLYDCALRVSECNSLKFKDYNQQKHTMYCERLKGGNNNTILLYDDYTVELLQDHIRIRKPSSANDYLFISQKGNPLSRKTIDALMKSYCEEAEIEDKSKWHIHTLRHTRAIEIAEAGADLKDLQFFLGHKHVDNTLIYFTYTTAQQKALYRKVRKSKYGKSKREN